MHAFQVGGDGPQWSPVCQRVNLEHNWKIMFHNTWKNKFVDNETNEWVLQTPPNKFRVQYQKGIHVSNLNHV